MMSHSPGRWFSAVLTALLSLTPLAARAQEAADDGAENSALGFERTPPRLSFTDGEVSFWRPGAADWTEAKVNTPLAVGDELSTGPAANLELQVGTRAYVRAGEATQIGLSTLEPDYLQLRIGAGTAALDLRELSPGHTLEIDTPNAAFTIERKGYYRIEVADGTTKFITRRGGRASVTTQGGLPAPIEANEQLVVTGSEAPVLATYGAPELDAWDRWNYGRSDEQIAAVSERYVPAGVYGAEDLDDHGDWGVVPTYGAVWTPRVAVGWTPYSAGNWVNDPYYGWTWVDDAPWGWAPFHYGRWVYVGNAWGWSPGPRVVRPYYAPALVAFYGAPSVSVSVSVGIGSFGWVALGWGEPVVPWWGPRGCRGEARWAGWGGPRVVNNITIKNKNTYNVNNIHGYQNANHRGALVTVDRNRFGRGNVREARLRGGDTSNLRPLNRGDLGVRGDRSSLSPSERRGTRPSRDLRERSVVTAREPGRTRGDGTRERSLSPRTATRNADARTAEPSRGRTQAREGSRIDARPARLQAPPVRTARADTPDRRSSVSDRASERSGRNRESAASAPRERAATTRERAPAPSRSSAAGSATRRERESTSPARPPARATTRERAPARESARGEARRSSVQAPPRARATERAPRASSAPQTRQERAAPSRPNNVQRERSSAREPSVRQAPRERASQPRESRASQPRERATPQRERAVQQPRSQPSPSQSAPRSRGGGNNERRNGDGNNNDGGGGGRTRRG